MASTVKFLILLLPFLISITAAVFLPAYPSPLVSAEFQKNYAYPPSFFVAILSSLGFQDLSTVAAEANLSAVTPITIFAPSDSSVLTCPSCSLPLLLQEHSVLGLYTHHFLRTLAFGTKIETLAPNRCLTITSTPVTASTAISTRKVFVNGVEITKQDIFNNGLVVVHALQGHMSHLSPLSCGIESMTSLAFPRHPPPYAAAPFVLMRFMLKDAMIRLRVRGYSLVALAMRMKYGDLSDLKSLTVFAIDDASIFAGGEGHAYVSDLMLHVVPNMLLMSSNLLNLPPGTALPTMSRGQKLVVTTAGGGGPLAPMRINYEKIRKFDLVYNKRIVVHSISTPFRHVYNPTAEKGYLQDKESRLSNVENSGAHETVAPAPSAGSHGTGYSH
ncbi:hypothetical protein M9H77_01489 [Catharanthus roseus]|uniref:Uncharacterized protein n=1 Tax=Catharanthus roseus TaxID=4058 RepID=A0ACC0C5Y3_CATRO|nr:hypothetical protein M9H77_01489 [Catharanthus roseus]